MNTGQHLTMHHDPAVRAFVQRLIDPLTDLCAFWFWSDGQVIINTLDQRYEETNGNLGFDTESAFIEAFSALLHTVFSEERRLRTVAQAARGVLAAQGTSGLDEAIAVLRTTLSE